MRGTGFVFVVQLSLYISSAVAPGLLHRHLVDCHDCYQAVRVFTAKIGPHYFTERNGPDRNASLFHRTERMIQSYTAQCAHIIPSSGGSWRSLMASEIVQTHTDLELPSSLPPVNPKVVSQARL